MPLNVFVSYKREDKGYKDELLERLRPFEINGRLSMWHDQELVAGEQYKPEILQQIRASDFVLLLISKDFLASDFCTLETETAMEREDARVIPIILDDACEWRTRPFARHQVVKWPDVADHLERAFAEVWCVSNLQPRNKHFTGREDVLAHLGEAHAHKRVPVLVGLDGVGKSSIAIEYAHRHAHEYSTIWWIHADEPSTLASDYAKLADERALEQRDWADQNAIVEAVKNHLAGRPGWLLIFDDADDPADVMPYLPDAAPGHVIVTTPNPPRPGEGTPVPVDIFTRSESVKLFLARSRATNAEAADELAHDLGDLPLALEHAAAYVERTASSIADYLESFRTVRHDTKSTIAATWKLSIDNIRDVAQPVMLCAFVAPDDIPRSLLNDSEGKLAVNRAIAAARAYSLIRADERAVAIHKLVQLVIRDQMSADERAHATRRVCAAVNLAFPMSPEDSREWRTAARMLPHGRAVCRLAEEEGVVNDDTGPLLNRAAMYLRHRGDLDSATATFAAAARWMVRFRGESDPALVTLRANVAVLRGETGDIEDAIAVFQEKLHVDRHTYGDLHTVIALDLSNLGNAYAEAGRPAEGLPLLREAEALFRKLDVEKYLGVTKSNIAMAFERMGDFASAANEIEAALAVQEKHYGPDNARLIRTLANACAVLTELGRFDEAAAHVARALAIAEREFGPDHEQTHRLRLEAALQAARTGDPFDAATQFNQALSGTLAAGYLPFAKTVRELLQILSDRGHPELARHYDSILAQLP
ncbi:MAG: hypothetical protein QOH21_1579 [Acidobacteriota bacterium]|nr:hypothetical protein [Acidobacteriota bacterium]